MSSAKMCEKHPYIVVNQNALDLFASFFLVLCNAVKMGNIRYTGAFGYILCTTLHSDMFVASGLYGSRYNIAAIAFERYLKVVHHIWSKKNLRPWIINSAMVFCCLGGIVVQAPMVFRMSGVEDGVCYVFHYHYGKNLRKTLLIWYLSSFYIIIFAILIFCYWRILVAIRRQAMVMATHNAAGPSTSQTHQSNQIQTNVIKTMILVSALYIFSHLLHLFMYTAIIAGSPVRVQYIDEASRFMQFFYVCANPFVYAIKFDPVKKVLKDMIPSRVVVWFNHAMSRVASMGN